MFSWLLGFILMLVVSTEGQAVPNDRGFYSQSRLLLVRLRAAVARMENLTVLDARSDCECVEESMGDLPGNTNIHMYMIHAHTDKYTCTCIQTVYKHAMYIYV